MEHSTFLAERIEDTERIQNEVNRSFEDYINKLRKKSKDKLNNSQISKFSSLQRRNQNPFQKNSTSKRKYRCLAILKTTPSINDFYNYYDFKYLWNNHNLGWICLFLASSFSISFKSDVPLLFPWLYFL